MSRNMGTLDRVIRGFVVFPVAVLAAVALGATSPAGIVALVVATIMLVTAVVGFCPLYAVFGLTTRAAPKAG